MQVPRRTRIIGGIAVGASATALVGGLVLGTPSEATTTHQWRTIAKPEAIDDIPAAALIEGEQMMVGAAGAGSYVVQRVGDHLTIVSTSVAPGWRVDVLHNDSRFVKAVFTGVDSRVFAAAKLGDDGLVDIAAFQDALPASPPPVVPHVVKDAVKAQAFADGDHDGFCDGHKGDGDFRSAGFHDGDRDRDGWHHHRHHRGGDDGWHDS
jgi:hypothetical protein